MIKKPNSYVIGIFITLQCLLQPTKRALRVCLDTIYFAEN